MSVHEECGVFGVMSTKKENVAEIAYYGLYALQHRGQESCGIVVNDDGVFSSYKELGLISEVFSKDTLAGLSEGTMAVGHVRYGTTGGATRDNCQPLEVNHQKGKMALAHNGNLSNALELRDKLELSGAIFHTTSDTETIAYVITRERLRTSSIEEAVSNAMNLLEGAYSLILMSSTKMIAARDPTIAYVITRERLRTSSIEEAVSNAMNLLEGAYSLILMSSTKMIAARDPYGFRPLCYGKLPDGGYVAASESCALLSVGAEPVRDLLPGEILVFSQNGVESRKEHCGKRQKKTCIFEYIYFARPDSVIDGVSVHESRVRAGELLAERYPAEADVVIGVPDSGMDAALGYANKSGIPYGIGLIKNKYIGRTFIAAKQNERLDKVRIKLSPVKSVIEYANKSGIPYGIGLIKNKYIGRTFIAAKQNERLDKVRIKLSPVKSVIEGKRIILVDDSIVRGTTSKRIVKLLRVDDSIVRGTTSKRIVKLLRDAGAKEIHMRISAPPFLHPCYYGTDIDSEENLIACHHSMAEIAEIIGVDSLGYLEIDKLGKLIDSEGYCAACFHGKYPTKIPADLRKDRFERRLSENVEY